MNTCFYRILSFKQDVYDLIFLSAQFTTPFQDNFTVIYISIYIKLKFISAYNLSKDLWFSGI